MKWYLITHRHRSSTRVEQNMRERSRVSGLSSRKGLFSRRVPKIHRAVHFKRKKRTACVCGQWWSTASVSYLRRRRVAAGLARQRHGARLAAPALAPRAPRPLVPLTPARTARSTSRAGVWERKAILYTYVENTHPDQLTRKRRAVGG